MRIGLAAVLGVILLIAGLLWQTLGDSKLGAVVAVVGLLACLGSTLAAHVWGRRHDDEFR